MVGVNEVVKSMPGHGHRSVQQASKTIGSDSLAKQVDHAGHSSTTASHRFQYVPLSSQPSQKPHCSPLSNKSQQHFQHSLLPTVSSSQNKGGVESAFDQNIPSIAIAKNFTATAMSSHTVTATLRPSVPETAEVSQWFVAIVLSLFAVMMAMTLAMAYTAMHDHRPANGRAFAQTRMREDEEDGSPGTEVQRQQRMGQELRQRRGQIVVGGVVAGDDERLHAMDTHHLAEGEKCSEVGMQEVEYREIKQREAMAQEVEVQRQRQWQREEDPAREKAEELLTKAKEKVASVMTWFDLVIENSSQRAAVSVRGEIEENPEKDLLLPVRDEEREDGEKGRGWLVAETKNRKDF